MFRFFAHTGVGILPKDIDILPKDIDVFPKGLDVFPKGIVILPRGIIVLPKGIIVCPKGIVVLPRGIDVLPKGIIICPKEIIIFPKGIVVCPIGIVVCPKGIVVFPKGIVVLSKGIVTLSGCIVLTELKKRGYIIHIITNGFKEVQWDKLANTGLDKFITDVYISEEIKAPKPAREIFEHAIRSSNARKKESVMIGDSWESDIIGAKNFGLDQVFFNI